MVSSSTLNDPLVMSDLPLLLAQAEPAHSNANVVYWAIGGFLVWNYAHGRFSSEKSIRSSTTYLRYLFAAGSYVLAMLGIYAGLSAVIASDGFKELLKIFHIEGGNEDSSSMKATAPLLSALLLTTAMPHIPILQRLDEALRSFCEKLGNVPWEAQSLANRLMLADYFVPELLRPQILEQTRDLVDNDEACFTDQQTLMSKWLQVSALIAQIRNWNESENVRYLRFYSFFKSELLDLEERWNWTRKGIKNKKSLEDFKFEIEKLRRQVCHIVARGVLFAEKSKHDRVRRVETLGFREMTPAVRQFVTIHELTAVGLIVFIMLAASSIIAGGGGQDVGRTLSIMAMVSLIYACSVWAAIYPKVVSEIWRADDGGHRPWMFYVLAGLIAVGLRFVVAFFFNLFTNGFDLLLAAEMCMWSVHYSIIVFAATVGFTAMADNFANRKEGAQPKWLRWVEGVALALILGSAAFIVQEWRISDFSSLPENELPESELYVISKSNVSQETYGAAIGAITGMKRGVMALEGASLLQVLKFPLNSAVIGFMLGIWVPSWYRRSMAIQTKMRENEVEELEGIAGTEPATA